MKKDNMSSENEDAQDILDEFFKELAPKPEHVIRDAKFCFSPEKTGCNGCPRYTNKCIGAWGAIECQDNLRADIINLAVSQQSELILEKARADAAELKIKRYEANIDKHNDSYRTW